MMKDKVMEVQRKRRMDLRGVWDLVTVGVRS